MTESTELAVITSPAEVADLPAEQRDKLITRALMESKDWLAVATKSTDPTPITHFKAWAACVAEMTKQKGLAQEIQLDALEMVRRAERGIGLAIRNGQEAGDIETQWANHDFRGNQHSRGADHPGGFTKAHPSDFARRSELAGSSVTKPGIYALTDDITDPTFEAGLSDAREEKNLSRANLVRKIKSVKENAVADTPPIPASQQLDLIAELARTGASSRQIAKKVGVTIDRLSRLTREHGIEVPADRIVGKTHRINPERVVRESVNTLQGVETSLSLLTSEEYDGFTLDQLKEWLKALEEPARAIRTLVKELNARVRDTTRHADEEGRASSSAPLDSDPGYAGVPAGPA